jgi:hypothetical protein
MEMLRRCGDEVEAGGNVLVVCGYRRELRLPMCKSGIMIICMLRV